MWSRELGTLAVSSHASGRERRDLHPGHGVSSTRSMRRPATCGMYDPAVPRTRAFFICCDVVNRGVALYKGKVYVGTLDGRLIALDAQSGKPVWSVATTDPAQPYAVTGYPRIAKDMVIIGNAGAEYGVRGYVSAYNAETERWCGAPTRFRDPKRGFESKAMEQAARRGAESGGRLAAAARRGRALSTIRRLTCCTSEPAMRRRGIATFEARRKTTTCMRRRFWPCGPATASWPGISRPCPATTGTSTPRSRWFRPTWRSRADRAR